MDSPDFLLDALLEPGPALLPAEGLQAPVDAILHHRDELLVAQEAVAVVVEYLKSVNKRINTSRAVSKINIKISNIFKF